MPEDEGHALHEIGVSAGVLGPLFEIGSYCGKSAIYLGVAAALSDTILFSVDHHRGSEENQVGWEHHDTDVVDASTNRIDTLPFFRRTIEEAALEEAVVAVVGHSVPISRAWGTPLGLVFIDGGHALEIAMADYVGWAPHVIPGGFLVFHDVFEDPTEGGQAPYRVWQRAVTEGFVPVSTTGSLRILERPD